MPTTTNARSIKNTGSYVVDWLVTMVMSPAAFVKMLVDMGLLLIKFAAFICAFQISAREPLWYSGLPPTA